MSIVKCTAIGCPPDYKLNCYLPLKPGDNPFRTFDPKERVGEFCPYYAQRPRDDDDDMWKADRMGGLE